MLSASCSLGSVIVRGRRRARGCWHLLREFDVLGGQAFDLRISQGEPKQVVDANGRPTDEVIQEPAR